MCRLGEIDTYTLRRCLKVLSDNPEPRATECILALLQSGSYDAAIVKNASNAMGKGFWKDPSVVTEEAIDTLCNELFNNPSYFAKGGAARAIGFSGKNVELKDVALGCLELFEAEGSTYPEPPDCDVDPVGCMQHRQVENAFVWQVGRAIIRIAGQSYQIGNPGDILQLRQKSLDAIKEYLEGRSGNGGAP